MKPDTQPAIKSLEEAERLLPGITALAKAVRERFGTGVSLKVRRATAGRLNTNENHSHLGG